MNEKLGNYFKAILYIFLILITYQYLINCKENNKDSKFAFKDCREFPLLENLEDDRGKIFRGIKGEFTSPGLWSFNPNFLEYPMLTKKFVIFPNRKQLIILIADLYNCRDQKDMAFRYFDFVETEASGTIYDCKVTSKSYEGVIAEIGNGYRKEYESWAENNIQKAWVFNEKSLRFEEVDPDTITCLDSCYKGSCN